MQLQRWAKEVREGEWIRKRESGDFAADGQGREGGAEKTPYPI